MKIRPVGVEFCAEGRIDGQTHDGANIFFPRNFANAPHKKSSSSSSPVAFK